MQSRLRLIKPIWIEVRMLRSIENQYGSWLIQTQTGIIQIDQTHVSFLEFSSDGLFGLF